MASYLDKTKITVGIDKNTTLDLSCQHITTADWMEGIPVYLKEMVPGESIKIHQETFSRMAPLAVPTFGRALIHNRAFFVPFRTIFHAWDEFITSVKHTNQLIAGSSNPSVTTGFNVNKVPYIKNVALVNFFLGSTTSHSGGEQITLPTITSGVYALSLNGTTRQLDYVGSSAVTDKSTQINDVMIRNGQYDIALAWYAGTGNATTKYFRLTSRGKRFLKLFESLGYKVIWAAAADQAGEGVLYERVADVMPEYSAMPLLAYWKVILDWYYPSQYVGDASYMFVDSLIHAAIGGSSTGIEVTESVLRNIFLASGGGLNSFSGLVNYDSDYFVSAFDNPVGASVGNNTSIIIPDITDVGQSDPATVEGEVTNTPVMTISGADGITQYSIDALKALTDYVKRNQLVGARALDRFYARFGKRLSDAKLDRSNYIGADNIPLQFADVMSHTATQDAPLGGYAGKGIAYGPNGNFEYQSGDDYGYIIVISSIVPQVGYYQGVDRNLLHLGRTDFWTPEFDQLGNQAIAKMEVVVPMNLAKDTDAQSANDFWAADTGDNPNDGITGVFGWTPRYAEYKIGRDKLTGDWRYGSTSIVGDTSDSWHLMRNIGGRMQDVLNIVHDKYVVSGYDRNQYSRIFQNINSGSDTGFDNADKFYIIHNFNVVSQSPMHSLYDSYKFENEDDSKKVVADVNGVKVN